MREKLVPSKVYGKTSVVNVDEVIGEIFGSMDGFFCLKDIINRALIASKWETLKGTRFWH